jgi:hypothetical protein
MPSRRRTWDRSGQQRPWDVYRADCGCWHAVLGARIWEPCMAHQGEGHLCVLSAGDGGVWVARCLVSECAWRTSWAQEDWAVVAAQEHWQATRAR